MVISGNVALDGDMIAAAGTDFAIGEGGSVTLAKNTTLDLSHADSYTGLSGAIKVGKDSSGTDVTGWSVKVGGSTEGSEGQEDLDKNLAVAEFKNTYKELLDLADDNDWSNNTIDETLLAKALAEFEDDGSVAGLGAEGEELDNEYNLLLKIQEWLAIKAATIPGVTGSNSTASQTTFTMPTVTNVNLTGAEITAYRVGSASTSTNLETPVPLAETGSTTVSGLAGLTGECKVVFTIKTALENKLEVEVTTEKAKLTTITRSNVTLNVATSGSSVDSSSSFTFEDQYDENFTIKKVDETDLTKVDGSQGNATGKIAVAASGIVTLTMTTASSSQAGEETLTYTDEANGLVWTVTGQVDSTNGVVGNWEVSVAEYVASEQGNG